MENRPDIYRQYLVWVLSGPFLYLNFWLLGQLFRYFEQAITILTLAAILALLLSYPVKWLEKHRINPFLAILLILVLLVAVVFLIGVTIIPLVTDQATQLLNALPAWLDGLTQQLSGFQRLALQHRVNINLAQVANQLEQLAQTWVAQLPGLAVNTVGHLVNTILIIVLALYMLLYGQQMWNGLIGLLPPRFGQILSQALQFNFQQFFITQVLLALLMFAGLIPIFILLKVKFALLFALIIGIFELIPFIGATIGILLVSLLSLLQGGWVALWVGIAAIALQQIRDNVIAPRLLGQFIGLNPIWIFVALLIGARIAGVLGVILAIPIAGTIKSTVEQLRTTRSPIMVARH